MKVDHKCFVELGERGNSVLDWKMKDPGHCRLRYKAQSVSFKQWQFPCLFLEAFVPLPKALFEICISITLGTPLYFNS